MLGESAYFVDEASKVPMWCKIFKDNIRCVTFDLDYWKLDHLIICLSNDIQYSWGVFGGSIKGKLLHAAWLPEITILTKVVILFQCLSTIAFNWIQTAREPHPTPVPLKKLTPSFAHSEQLPYFSHVTLWQVP
jgi:hypothetical protein